MMGRRHIVVPLLDGPETDDAVDLACRLAGRWTRLDFVAPLVVDQELPLDAHFPDELPHLKERLDRACAVADLYGVDVSRRVLRVREGGLGRALAEEERDAKLVVVGSARDLARDVRAVLRDMPCPVLVLSR